MLALGENSHFESRAEIANRTQTEKAKDFSMYH